MKLDRSLLVISIVITTASLWVICSLIVLLYPETSAVFTEQMMHLAPGQIRFEMSWVGFFSGLCSWVIFAAAGGWMLAFLYDKLRSSEGDEHR